MKPVTVYTTEYCPYCQNAKRLLSQKGVPFTEINLSDKPDELAQLKKRTGMRTVPQIFIGEELVGGFMELMALETSKQLDKKLTD